MPACCKRALKREREMERERETQWIETSSDRKVS